jgi:hypothetical protein
MGLAPIHLFKVEIYKGVPLFSVLFYTTFYFLSFLFYFFLIVVTQLSAYYIYWWFLLIFLIILGALYIVSLLFDVNFIKAFFAYSTILNTINFLSLVLTNFS